MEFKISISHYNSKDRRVIDKIENKILEAENILALMPVLTKFIEKSRFAYVLEHIDPSNYYVRDPNEARGHIMEVIRHKLPNKKGNWVTDIFAFPNHTKEEENQIFRETHNGGTEIQPKLNKIGEVTNAPFPTLQAKISKQGKKWYIMPSLGRFRITNINENSKLKLKALYQRGKKIFFTYEKITEYPSNEYRCKISEKVYTDWHYNDVSCLACRDEEM